ncbi:hypothetical protein EJ06DRAFT_584340 [Trichodelitschia bisporula]|uniref:Subtilisin-like serine protease n=1 Tax=Trichodelitschia bisporula TaxID=703511 RepID=A0A6G1HN11_9PEZI|nr:hypothetical protein EJ06DRAFT_584340 [Trichodelitschia bisporula]
MSSIPAKSAFDTGPRPTSIAVKFSGACPFSADLDVKLQAAFEGHGSPPTSAQPSASTISQDGQQAPTAHALPQHVLDTLPVFRHDSDPAHTVVFIESDLKGYLQVDLDVSRLNKIHSSLWMCGRPLNARGLHRQEMMGRTVLRTEQADLHLLYGDALFLKPLPTYLLSKAAWDTYLNDDEHLHKDACGFLLSYTWLVRSPLDFARAEKLHLLPHGLTWLLWKRLVWEFLNSIDPNSLHQVNKRYHFGELRLGRINTIYRVNPRFVFQYFVRGYLYGYNRYAVFFQRNVGWVLVVFVWFSLILSAMQVGVAVDPLQESVSFKKASYGFVVFSIVSVAALLVFVGVVFATIFLFNMVAAVSHSRSEELRRAKLAEAKSE